METTYTLNEIDSIAALVIAQAKSRVLLFNAEMGMGKTTLIKAIIKILGSDDAVSSPTFSLVNEYKSKNESIYHFDLYRIENEEELFDFGIEDYLNSNSWLLVEWPGVLLPFLPANVTTISIDNTSNNESRFINIS